MMMNDQDNLDMSDGGEFNQNSFDVPLNVYLIYYLISKIQSR